MYTKSSFLKHYDFILLDNLCLVISFVLMYYVRHNTFAFYKVPAYILMLFAMIMFNILLFFILEPFKSVLRRGKLSELRKTLLYDFANMMLISFFLFITKEGSTFSRLFIGLTYLVYFLASLFTRNIYKQILNKRAHGSNSAGDRSLFIMCNKKSIHKTIEDVCKHNYSNYRINGICVMDDNLKGNDYDGFSIVCNPDEVTNYIVSNWVDEIYINCNYRKLPSELLDDIIALNIPVHVSLEEDSLHKDRVQSIGKIGLNKVITTMPREFPAYQLFLKRCMDICGGLIGCFITLILILIIGPIIYFKSPGNIIYTSNRVGMNGKVFKFYKFRSMRLDADDLKEQLQKQNRVKDGMMFKIKDDPRIIPGIGNFIRKTSLDEFPQFFNVLKGDMSLVGTRPPTIDEWNKYTPYHKSRLSFRPGITGMWQISGRSSITNFNEVVRLDNEYISNWDIWLDLKILYNTVLKLFNRGDDDAM